MALFSNIKFKIVLLLSLTLFSFQDEDPGKRNVTKIVNRFQSFVDSIHPQKIYLHLDKEIYYVNERIWFKAYLLHEPTLIPDSSSDHLYVELVNSYDQIVQIIRVNSDIENSSGSFYLGDTIPEGIYQIRAYTNWMKNFGPEYFFSKNIKIRNPKKQYLITPKEARTNRRILKKSDKNRELFTIGFFPEGGDLLENIESRVAFKAEDGYGNSAEITGSIVDKNKNTIVSFSSIHNGMGSFKLTPEKNNSYTAYVKFPDGSQKKLVLPEAKTNSVGLTLKVSDKLIDIKLLSNKMPSSDRPANEFVLIGQIRSKIYYAAYINLLDRDSIFRISPDMFPSGIVHFTLFNNRLQPIAQRLHFINHNDFRYFDINSSTRQDSIEVQINPKTDLNEDEKFMGSVAVVVADQKNTVYPDNHIITRLLLTSDLPGIIEQPDYYLNTANPIVAQHTDLLMLTHGWKRFIWEDILEGNFPKIKFEREEGITITGMITREIFEFPIKNADVRLYIMDEYNDEFQTRTDKKGSFFFNQMYYYDTVNVKIVARKPRGGKNLLIHLEEESYDQIVDRYGDFFLTTSSKLDMKAYRHLQSEIAREEMRIREKELDSIFRDNIYGTPDYVLWGDEIPSGYTNLLDAMQGRIPGVNIVGDRVTIRGINSIMGSNEPLLVIDGIPTSMDAINSIPVQDVERIEILKGPSAAMYGSRGANGVIAIHTKRGMFMKKGEIAFSMLGYHVTEQFYSPAPKAIDNRIQNNQLPLTIFWEPNITLNQKDMLDIVFPSKTPDKGFYVIFEGISNQGKAGYSYAFFRN